MPKKTPDYRKMSLSEIEGIRKATPRGPMRDFLAGKEHRAFTRDFSRDAPLTAGAILPLAIPAYAAGKHAYRNLPPLPAPVARARSFLEENMPGGQYIRKSREYFGGTRPSLGQMAEAYEGMGEGLGGAMRDQWRKLRVQRWTGGLRRLAGL